MVFRHKKEVFSQYMKLKVSFILSTCFCCIYFIQIANAAKNPYLEKGEPIRIVATIDGRITDTNNGRTVYEATCAFCHGLQGEGGLGGGISLFSATNIEVVMDRVRNGLEIMPGFGGSLTEEEIQDVSAYVVEELPH